MQLQQCAQLLAASPADAGARFTVCMCCAALRWEVAGSRCLLALPAVFRHQCCFPSMKVTLSSAN